MIAYYLGAVGVICLGACIWFGYQGDDYGCKLYAKLFALILILAVIYDIVSSPTGKCFYF